MNLSKKKALAIKTLDVGKERVLFVKSRLEEIKEAITKQDIRDLVERGAIIIKQRKGRKKVVKVKRKKTPGKIRKKINTRKKDYVILTRKLRAYVSDLKKYDKISNEDFLDIRKKIRNKIFKSKANLKDYIGGLKK
jgi:large subunit ribosomal protein L19e